MIFLVLEISIYLVFEILFLKVKNDNFTKNGLFCSSEKKLYFLKTLGA